MFYTICTDDSLLRKSSNTLFATLTVELRKMKMKSLIHALSLCSLLPLMAIADGSPGSQINLATLKLEQGATIYANGNMQAVVRVNLSVAEGVTVTSTKLKEFGTGLDLGSLGYTVSETENSYWHYINGSSSSSISSVGSDETLYISTRNNQNINVCVEVNAELNGSSDMYTTCADNGIQNGTVNIASIVPPRYTNQDFDLSLKKIMMDEIHTKVVLYTLKPGNSIPSNIDFTSPQFVENLTFWEDSRKQFMHDYQLGEKISSYVGTYALRPDEKINIRILHSVAGREYLDSTSEPGYVTKTIDAYQGIDASALILNVQYHAQDFLVEEYRCDDETTNNFPIYTCTHPNSAPLVYNQIACTLPALTDKSTQLELIDNYGTTHFVTFYYGSGKENDEPFI